MMHYLNFSPHILDIIVCGQFSLQNRLASILFSSGHLHTEICSSELALPQLLSDAVNILQVISFTPEHRIRQKTGARGSLDMARLLVCLRRGRLVRRIRLDPRRRFGRLCFFFMDLNRIRRRALDTGRRLGGRFSRRRRGFTAKHIFRRSGTPKSGRNRLEKCGLRDVGPDACVPHRKQWSNFSAIPLRHWIQAARRGFTNTTNPSNNSNRIP